MKTTLVVAFALMLFSSVARSDEVSAYGVLYVPDGSTVTSIAYINPGEAPEAVVSFTFADGSGVFYDAGPFGAWGSIDFTTPVSDLSFDWYAPTFHATDNLGDVYNPPLQPLSNDPAITGTAIFAGPGISSIQWSSYVNSGQVGIESMNYTLDGTDPPNVPEPPSLLLSGMGLAALIGLTFRNRAATKQSY